MKTELIKADHPVVLRHAADILKNGGLVAFPTDTVYGLAALPFQEEFIERLFIAKRRSSNRAIGILLGERTQLSQVASHIGRDARKLAAAFWPGPLTIIVPRQPRLPSILSADLNVGVRIPDHPVALALLRLVGPLAVTSANVSDQPNTNSAEEVMDQLKGRIHLVIDGGRSPGGVPSTVIDCSGDELVLLRNGPISMQDIQTALKQTAD